MTNKMRIHTEVEEKDILELDANLAQIRAKLIYNPYRTRSDLIRTLIKKFNAEQRAKRQREKKALTQ